MPRHRRGLRNRTRAGVSATVQEAVTASPQRAELTDWSLGRHIILTGAAPRYRIGGQAYSLKADGWIPMLCASGLIDRKMGLFCYLGGTSCRRRTARRTILAFLLLPLP
jgi:hypothetical protein